MDDINLHKKIGLLEEKLTGKNSKIHDLELRVTELENSLWRIANPIMAMENDANKEGAKLDGHMALSISKDAETLKSWAYSALNN